MGRFTGKSCRMSTMFVLTFAFFLVEVIFGYITKSMALIADSFHMLSDVLALIIAFACMKISKLKTSPKNTFGWVRAEVLGALVNTVFLVALSFSIILESIERFFNPVPISDSKKVLIVGALGLGVNIIGLFLFHGHGGGHGHSHGGGGGGHGHSHGAKKGKPDSGHGHSHKDGHGHSHGRKIRDSHGHSHDAESPDAHKTDEPCHEDVFESGQTVEEPEPDFDPKLAAAVRRVRRQSSKYYMTGEELAAVAAAHQKAQTEASAGGKAKASSSMQMNMHGIWLHVMGDAFGSIVVIVNALVNWFTNVPFLHQYLDPLLSLLMSALIIGSSIPLLKESIMVLLQSVPTHINVQEVKEKLLSKFGHTIADMHEFHVWRLSGNKIVATAHIRVRGDLDDYMKLAEKLKEFFHDEGIHSTTIQPELIQGRDTKTCALKCPKKNTGERPCVEEACCEVPPTPIIQTTPTNPLASASNRLTSTSSRISFASNPPATITEESVDNDHDGNENHI